MFTGLIEQVGSLLVKKRGSGAKLAIHHKPWTEALVIGESVAVSGVCLTIAEIHGSSFFCDVLGETLATTTFGNKNREPSVNLERAMPVGGRLGGHILSGHVDGVGTVIAKRKASEDWVFGIQANEEIMEGIILKGSIACDGISLTVTSVSKTSFEVNVIPVTIKNSTLGSTKVGAKINLETDLLGKYVRKHLNAIHERSGINMDTLKNAGFLK